MRARWTRGRAAIVNAGKLYIAETQRDVVEDALGKVSRRALVDLRVGADGDVSVLRLRVGDQTFGDAK